MIGLILVILGSWPSGIPADSRAHLDAIWDSYQEQIVDQIDDYFHTGKWDHNTRLGYVLLEIDPGDLEAFSNQGFLLGNGMDRYEEAEQLYRRAVQEHPLEWAPVYDLVFFLYWRQRYQDAIEPGEKMLAMHPKYMAYHLVAHVYEKSGDLKKSVWTWDRCIEKFPVDDVGKMNRDRVQKLIEAK